MTLSCINNLLEAVTVVVGNVVQYDTLMSFVGERVCRQKILACPLALGGSAFCFYFPSLSEKSNFPFIPSSF